MAFGGIAREQHSTLDSPFVRHGEEVYVPVGGFFTFVAAKSVCRSWHGARVYEDNVSTGQ